MYRLYQAQALYKVRRRASAPPPLAPGNSERAPPPPLDVVARVFSSCCRSHACAPARSKKKSRPADRNRTARSVQTTNALQAGQLAEAARCASRINVDIGDGGELKQRVVQLMVPARQLGVPTPPGGPRCSPRRVDALATNRSNPFPHPQALVKYREGDLRAARGRLDEMPDDSHRVVNLAALSFREKRYDEALRLYELARKAEGNTPKLGYNVALCLFHLREYGRALKELQEVIDRAAAEHPELHVRSGNDGAEQRSVGNSALLIKTRLIECFNLKARGLRLAEFPEKGFPARLGRVRSSFCD